MQFNSLSFFVFLIIVFILYWIVPKKYKWVVLLIASYYFYMNWNALYSILIFFTTLVSFLMAIKIDNDRSKGKKNSKLYLFITLLLCLGILFFFKYFNFLSKSLSDLFGFFSIKYDPIVLKILLPVGISFYTFQTLSYVIDVYRGEISSIKHFGKYATFITFFPQLVAGPIERSRNLLPQIVNPPEFDYDKAKYGFRQMLWGFFKKTVIADTLAIYVNLVYNNLGVYSGFSLVIATVFFAIQIYCDFSGYSDIAIGCAKLFGIDLMTNFKSPYFAQSIKDFWSRWHISLSTWFRDYVYIPLGGNRVGKIRSKVNLIITFLVSGLWHGANFTFIIWGAIHGFLQVFEKMLFKNKIRNETKFSFKWCLRVLVVFIICTFAWIFFRANSLSDAIYVLSNSFSGISKPLNYICAGINALGLDLFFFIEMGICVLGLFVFDFFSIWNDLYSKIDILPKYIRIVIYVVLIWVIFTLAPTEVSEFIYFQF